MRHKRYMLAKWDLEWYICVRDGGFAFAISSATGWIFLIADARVTHVAFWAGLRCARLCAASPILRYGTSDLSKCFPCVRSNFPVHCAKLRLWLWYHQLFPDRRSFCWNLKLEKDYRK